MTKSDFLEQQKYLMLEQLVFAKFKLTWNINVMYLELFPRFVWTKPIFLLLSIIPL